MQIKKYLVCSFQLYNHFWLWFHLLGLVFFSKWWKVSYSLEMRRDIRQFKHALYIHILAPLHSTRLPNGEHFIVFGIAWFLHLHPTFCNLSFFFIWTSHTNSSTLTLVCEPRDMETWKGLKTGNSHSNDYKHSQTTTVEGKPTFWASSCLLGCYHTTSSIFQINNFR